MKSPMPLGFLKDIGIASHRKVIRRACRKVGPALASGTIDIAGAVTPAIINAIAAGAKILCVMPRASRCSGHRRVEEPYRRPNCLRRRAARAVHRLRRTRRHRARQQCHGRALIDQHLWAVNEFATGSVKTVDWVAPHPDEARKPERSDIEETGRRFSGCGLLAGLWPLAARAVRGSRHEILAGRAGAGG